MAESTLSKLKFSVQKIEILLEELKKDSYSQKQRIESLENTIKGINFRLENEYLSFKNIGKKILFLASVLGALFGAVQLLFRFLGGFIK